MRLTTRLGILVRRLKRTVGNRGLTRSRLLAACAQQFHLHVLVETGTYLGDSVNALRNHFEEIHSIELDDALYEHAVWRFRRFPHIHVYHGDSAVVLPQILVHISEPCLFWLDAHVSGGLTARGVKNTPVMDEVRTITGHRVRGHVILLDDAGSFAGKEDYPTVQQLRSMLPEWNVDVIEGVICAIPVQIEPHY